MNASARAAADNDHGPQAPNDLRPSGRSRWVELRIVAVSAISEAPAGGLGRVRQSEPPHPRLPSAAGAAHSSVQKISHLTLSCRTHFSVGAGNLEIGRGSYRLAVAASAGPGCRRHAPRRRALLSQEPLARRIRVRPRLGGGLRPRRRQLLSEAAGRGTVHAGDRPPAAGAARPARRATRAELSSAVSSSFAASTTHPAYTSRLRPKTEYRFLGELGFLQRTDQQFHWENAGYATASTISSLRSRRASARPSAANARKRSAERHHVQWLTGSDLTEDVWDRVLRLLHGDRLAQMGPPLSDPPFFSLDRRDDARPHPAGDGQAGRTLDRGRDQLHRLGHIVRPPLGRDRASSVPAFRAVLLSGDRLRHRAQACARRGRRAGRAQDRARLHADHHLFGALHRRSGAAARPSPIISSASAPMWPRSATSLPPRGPIAKVLIGKIPHRDGLTATRPPFIRCAFAAGCAPAARIDFHDRVSEPVRNERREDR